MLSSQIEICHIVPVKQAKLRMWLSLPRHVQHLVVIVHIVIIPAKSCAWLVLHGVSLITFRMS